MGENYVLFETDGYLNLGTVEQLDSKRLYTTLGRNIDISQSDFSLMDLTGEKEKQLAIHIVPFGPMTEIPKDLSDGLSDLIKRFVKPHSADMPNTIYKIYKDNIERHICIIPDLFLVKYRPSEELLARTAQLSTPNRLNDSDFAFFTNFIKSEDAKLTYLIALESEDGPTLDGCTPTLKGNKISIDDKLYELPFKENYNEMSEFTSRNLGMYTDEQGLSITNIGMFCEAVPLSILMKYDVSGSPRNGQIQKVILRPDAFFKQTDEEFELPF